ncbi:MAG: hypothetical protein MRZ79_08310 [Bacteroidia bacterium]|nr:hypothetical protein [Bacteroidia bacterium]
MKAIILSILLTCSVAISYAVPFTLRNNSTKSIYLKIPGVMNPNLSPMSNSRVDLKVGQKIYFFVKKKKYLLLEVTEEFDGEKVVVNQLIKERKKELGL